jgi:hypothetical protein
MRRLAIAAALSALGVPAAASAQALPASTLEFQFVPTARTQMAIWIEKPDGTFLATVKLTQAVSYRGIGNRPGASEMNSGFRWPYGRREGVLPVWAHRRAAADGAAQFRRVIFQDRISEGDASQAERSIPYDSSPDQYFCLSFNADTTRKAALDAVSCATAFNSDKGRYLKNVSTDPTKIVPETYAEPAVIGGVPQMRGLDYYSLYPPRRDLTPCCVDTQDVYGYPDDARAVMPDIDAVTLATPPPDIEQSILFTAPDDWPVGDYVAWIEVNVEGDYNDTFNAQTYPTPMLPDGEWDVWAETYGYAYRGQPSVVYSVPFSLGSSQTYGTSEPAGYGDINGFGTTGGDLNPIVPGMITDDPNTVDTQGSGADRLRLTAPGAYRFSVTVQDGKQCQTDTAPSVPQSFQAAPVADVKHSHEWGHMSFVAPASDRPIAQYEVRFSKTPITTDDPTSFSQALPAVAAMIDTEQLMVPTTGAPGSEVAVDFGGMVPRTQYWVAVRAVDICNVAGPYAVADLTTTKINFTQLSGCFVATAAYGSPLEAEVGALRAARDALRPRSVLAAAATDLYYRSSPPAAAMIAGSDAARAITRVLLGPVVEIAEIATSRER